MTVNVRAKQLDVGVIVPREFKGQTRGLMGVMNGDSSDDLTTPGGKVISTTSTERDIFYKFSEKCK